MAGIGALLAAASDRSASPIPATGETSRKASEGRYGPAPIIGPRPKRDGLLQLQIQREILIADLRQARRNHRSTSEISAHLRRLTHKILTSEAE